jgi:hypothetical protein
MPKARKARKESDYLDSVVYCLESVDGAHKYVGCTNNLSRRKIHHKYRCTFEEGKNYNLKLYKIIRENGGIETFNWRVLENCSYDTFEELSKREKYYIKIINPNMNTNGKDK